MINTKPIRHDLIDAAGLPGTPRRCMVFAALQVAMRPPATNIDKAHFARECVDMTADALELKRPPAVAVYDIPNAKALMIMSGLREIAPAKARAGDVMMFDSSYGVVVGVKIAEPEMTPYEGICAGWLAAPELSADHVILTPNWMRAAAAAFTWEPA